MVGVGGKIRRLRVTKINLNELPIELNSEHVESLEDGPEWTRHLKCVEFVEKIVFGRTSSICSTWRAR